MSEDLIQKSATEQPDWVDFLLPVTNANDTSAFVLKWYVEEGDRIDAGSPLLAIETSKASLELESPVEGFVERMVSEGTKVAGATPLARIYLSWEAYAASALVGADQSENQNPAASQPGRMATKAALELAAAMGLDLAELPGRGLITKREVERWLAQQQEYEVSPKSHPQSGEMSLSANQWRIACALRNALTTGVPGFVSRSVAANSLVTFCQDYARSHRFALSETDVFLKACARTLLQFTYLNASRQSNTVHLYSQVRIALALNVEDQLVAPVIVGAERLSLRDIATWRLQAQLRVRRAEPELLDQPEPTFTLSNLAPEGVELFIPNLVPRQAGTLGIGKRGARGSSLEWVLCLTFDHTIVNGGYAARFLKSLADLLTQPESLV